MGEEVDPETVVPLIILEMNDFDPVSLPLEDGFGIVGEQLGGPGAGEREALGSLGDDDVQPGRGSKLGTASRRRIVYSGPVESPSSPRLR